MEGRSWAQDGCVPWQVEEGWDIAPGDGDDLQVCRLHPWQSDYLAFADGHFAGTSAAEATPYGTFKGCILAFCTNLFLTVLGEKTLGIHPTTFFNYAQQNFISNILLQ